MHFITTLIDSFMQNFSKSYRIVLKMGEMAKFEFHTVKNDFKRINVGYKPLSLLRALRMADKFSSSFARRLFLLVGAVVASTKQLISTHAE